MVGSKRQTDSRSTGILPRTPDRNVSPSRNDVHTPASTFAEKLRLGGKWADTVFDSADSVDSCLRNITATRHPTVIQMGVGAALALEGPANSLQLPQMWSHQEEQHGISSDMPIRGLDEEAIDLLSDDDIIDDPVMQAMLRNV